MAVVWPDMEIRFDVNEADLKLRKGEVLVKAYQDIEDTKGNNGEAGTLHLTNLRVMWRSGKRKRINLYVGFGMITDVIIRDSRSRQRGPARELFIKSKHDKSKYEFLFTTQTQDSSKLSEVQNIFQTYKESEFYRIVKLRREIVSGDKELILLAGEQVFNKVMGVWNLSADVVRTCLRIAWMPYMHAYAHMRVHTKHVCVCIRAHTFKPYTYIGMQVRASYIGT